MQVSCRVMFSHCITERYAIAYSLKFCYVKIIFSTELLFCIIYFVIMDVL